MHPIFDNYSYGVLTNRDAWVYNFSKTSLSNNIQTTIDFYNEERERFFESKSKEPDLQFEKFIKYDSTRITWDTRRLKGGLEKNKVIAFDANDIRIAIYRPFCKQHLYFNHDLNHSRCSFPNFFPLPSTENIFISTLGIGANKDFCALISNTLPDLEMISKGQCFPLYTYEKIEIEESGLFDTPAESGYRKKENITDAMLSEFRTQYADVKISKEDIFYYVYGVLHSPEYKTRFASDLKKMLPRIPYAKDFWAFSVAGRDLAALHLNYETIEPYALIEEISGSANFTVEKMKFPSKADKSKIIYNGTITLSGIPPEAYEYVVNGKSAIEWIMERYAVTVDKDSGIKNNPNDWSDDPRYILDLVKRIVAVSLGSVEIVKGLPALEEYKG